MSDTPRTDAAVIAVDSPRGAPVQYVTADFARQLERELAVADAHRYELLEALYPRAHESKDAAPQDRSPKGDEGAASIVHPPAVAVPMHAGLAYAEAQLEAACAEALKDSDTPRTDSLYELIKGDVLVSEAILNLARQLERELAKAERLAYEIALEKKHEVTAHDYGNYRCSMCLMPCSFWMRCEIDKCPHRNIGL